MAYAAVISLKHTIQCLLNSSDTFTVLPKTQIALRYAYRELESLQEVLERLDDSSSSRRSSERVTVLDGQIRDAVHKLKDELESRISDQFLSQSEGLRGENHLLSFYMNLKKLKQEIHSFVEIKKVYAKELSYPLPAKKDDAAAGSSVRTDFGGEKSKMVGSSVEYSKLKDHFIRSRTFAAGEVVALVGMAGIGQKYQLCDIQQGILDQVYPDSSKKEGDEELYFDLYLKLKFTKYLIVLDDVWDGKIWDNFKGLLQDAGKGSRVMVTTREEVPNYFARAITREEPTNMIPQFKYSKIHQIQMRLLDKEESWYLLCKKVFGEQSCPPQLEKAGKKIAEKCDGLPLTIVTVAKLLSKDEKTAEYWKKVAKGESSVFVDAYDQMLEVLIPSYHYLPQHLKACFLYMGAFPQNFEIPTSKLIKLWSAEGFAETGASETIGYFAMKCLKNLVCNNLLMVRQQSYDCRIKTCSLHSAFWQLCVRVAKQNKFLHVLNSYDDDLAETINGQRRLCIHYSILFGIKDVYNLMALISAAHSLLCTGQHHQYPVPLCLGLRLLRVLDALTIRFYEFPMEILNLVHLRYLALTYNGKLPASISKLWNLQFLIVRQHLSVKFPPYSLYLPLEIWDMKELKHLQVMGSDLPEPNGGSCLQNLLTLLDVSACNCTRGVLGNLHHLKKLGIRFELAPDAAELLSCFSYISNLRLLESLKCVIVNPTLMSEVVAPPPTLFSMFPLHLKKLTLSGFGYGWEEMSKIALLRNLKVLKLRCYIFQGPEWITQREKFYELEYLLIEDTDLVHWSCDHWCFPSLKRLVIRHCYKLKEIPQVMYRYSNLQTIEVVDRAPSVVTWTKQMQQEKEDSDEPYSPWDDGILKSWIKRF